MLDYTWHRLHPVHHLQIEPKSRDTSEEPVAFSKRIKPPYFSRVDGVGHDEKALFGRGQTCISVVFLFWEIISDFPHHSPGTAFWEPAHESHAVSPSPPRTPLGRVCASNVINMWNLKMEFGRLFSSTTQWFSGSMLNFRCVLCIHQLR